MTDSIKYLLEENKAPKFWYNKHDTIYSGILYPFSLLFRFGTKLRIFFSIVKPSPIPTITPHKTVLIWPVITGHISVIIGHISVIDCEPY